jgi:hypothetical protein
MADLLKLELTEHARIALATLGPEDRRLVDAWLDHLKNWWNDDYIRSKSSRLKPDEEIYVFQTSTDLMIAFEIAGDKVIVLSIFSQDTLRKFKRIAEPSTP